MDRLCFGNIGSVILFGGGRVLRHLAEKLSRSSDYKVHVFTSDRLVTETVEGVPLGDHLRSNNIEFEVVSDINGHGALRALVNEGSLGISFGAPWFFKKETIKMFDSRLLNSHARDLPRNRGGGGFSWLILNGEKVSSSVLHLIDSGIDSGDIVKKRNYTFPESCKIPVDYESYAYEMDKVFFQEFFEDIAERRTFELIEQDHDKSTYFPRLHSLSHAFIDWSWNRDDIIEFIRAFDDPYCGASTYLNNDRVFLKKCETAMDDNAAFHPYLSGLVYRVNDKGLFIATRTGGILVSEAKKDDGRSIIREIRVGQRLFTPSSDLEKAREFHPIYTHGGLKE